MNNWISKIENLENFVWFLKPVQRMGAATEKALSP